MVELLVGRKVGLKVRRAGDGAGVHADFFRGLDVVDPARGNAQFLVGGDRVVHAVKLGAGDERGVQAFQNALAVLFQQVAVGAFVVVEGGEQALRNGADVAQPVSGEEDVDLLAGLEGRQGLLAPVAGGDDLELDMRTDQRLDVGIDRVLDIRADVDVLVAELVVNQRRDVAGGGGSSPALSAGVSAVPSVAAGESAGVSVVVQAVMARTITKTMNNAVIFLIILVSSFVLGCLPGRARVGLSE